MSVWNSTDADIASLAVIIEGIDNDTNALLLKVGEPVVDLATDIASVQTDVDTTLLQVGGLHTLVGTTADDEADVDTIFGKLYSILKHMHSPQQVYPTLANGVTVTGGVGVWALGAFVEVVPVNTITSPFDIHFVNIGAVSANDTYEVVLYSGLAGAEVEIGRFRATRLTAAAGSSPVQMSTPMLPANTRISAKVASSSGGADTLTFSIFYHTY